MTEQEAVCMTEQSALCIYPAGAECIIMQDKMMQEGNYTWEI